jgi:hypothetical protein
VRQLIAFLNDALVDTAEFRCRPFLCFELPAIILIPDSFMDRVEIEVAEEFQPIIEADNDLLIDYT